MNLTEYISSGILEAYALGELSPEERVEVEKNLALFPVLRDELSRIEETQESFLQAFAINPPVAVEQALSHAIESQDSAAKVRKLDNENSRQNWMRFAVAASVTIAIINSYLAFDYWNKWKRSENNLNDMIAQNQRIAQEYDQVNDRLYQIESDLEILDNPSVTRIIMEGTANAPEAMAYVYWNRATNEVYLSIKNMKQLPTESQYQLWAIAEGKPIDAGVFDSDDVDTLLKMKSVAAGASVFAVTIEPRGGQKVPTLETMQVAGNIDKG